MQRERDDADRGVARETEQKTIARAKRGQPDAFRALVDAYKDRLFAFIWRMVRNHHEAEDICQATFVKAFESLSSYSETYAFSTWLFTIGYRLCLNTLRKRKAFSGETDFSTIGGGEADVALTIAGSEEAARLRRLIWDAVEKLTPAQKTAVLLFYREGQSCQDIGVVLGVPAVTVKSHLHRAREKLRELLGAELVEDWMEVRNLSDSGTA